MKLLVNNLKSLIKTWNANSNDMNDIPFTMFLDQLKSALRLAKKIDPADTALFAMYHAQANPDRGISISDIDTLLKMQEKFTTKHHSKSWEDDSWEDAIMDWYNDNKPESWNPIPTATDTDEINWSHSG